MPSREFRTDRFGTGGRIPSRVAMGLMLLGLAMLPAGCDFSRAPGQSAWGGESPWYGDAPSRTASVTPRSVQPRALPPPPPPPRAAPVASAGTPDLTPARPVVAPVPPPQPAPVEPPAVLPEPVPLTAPAGRQAVSPPAYPPAAAEPAYATGPRVAAVEPPATRPLPVALPSDPGMPPGMPMDPITVAAPRSDAPEIAIHPEETVKMRGRLMRSFGSLGRVELHDGIILTRAGSGTPTAWCAYAGNPAMTIATAEGVCLFDRDGDRMFDTMAVLNRPELGYMQMGPFPYMAQY